jgi:cysteine desulfurase/selenocysteine lyase
MSIDVSNEQQMNNEKIIQRNIQKEWLLKKHAHEKIQSIRNDFPILNRKVNGHRLAYLDSAATAQKPDCMLKAMEDYYLTSNANIHRGVHSLSTEATELYEKSRQTVQRFINASSAKECIFTRGTTEAINLIAASFGNQFIHENDEILISAMEHHSNIVPWQILCEQRGALLKVIPMDSNGELKMDTVDKLLSSKTKLVAISHVSNALGTLNPIAEIIKKAHHYDIPVLVDGAQAAPHLKVDVQALDCDFYAFSGHKIYGPTGIGVLYGKSRWLETLPPYQAGGEMILSVTFEKTLYNEIPYKFEAGTPPIAEAVGLAASLDYLNAIGWDIIQHHEQDLLKYATDALSSIKGITVIGTAKEKRGVISFTLEGIHPHDIGSIVDQVGVAIRTGHHCAMPTMDFFNVPATARASFGIYNNEIDVDQLVEALDQVKKIFKV